MNIDELVKYRFSRAEEALEEAHSLASENIGTPLPTGFITPASMLDLN